MPLEFSAQIDVWVEKAKVDQDVAVRAIVLAAVKRVKELTPVKTGFLRSNWAVVRNDGPIPMPGRVPDIAQTVAAIRAGDRILIVNPVIYARRIEFGFVGQDSLGRYYDQKGRGMMTQTIAELPRIAERAIARVSLGGPAAATE